MSHSKIRAALAAAMLATTFLPVAAAHAANGDCSQPVSDGAGPVASDCLFVLRSAVGSSECAPCVCDTNASGSTTASDALLCLRAAVGQSVTLDCQACCQAPLDVTAEEIEAVLLASLDENQDYNVPAICGGQVPVCCTGGVPMDPCGPVHVDQIDATFVEVQGQNRVDVTIAMRLVSLTPIPVQVPLVGNCVLEIDTNAGPKTTIRIEAELGLAEDGPEIVAVENVTIADLTADDYALGGSTACESVPLDPAQAASALEEPLADLFSLYAGMCLGTDASLP